MFALQQFAVIYALTFLGQNVLGSEIINGEIAPDNEMLYMASVLDYRGYHICGGFLVSQNFVMTAAHCDVYPTHVVLGNHHLRRADKVVIQIAWKYKNKDFHDVNSGNDIMLLKLSTPVQPSKTIQFIRLPFHEMTLNENEKCQVAGWGKIDTRGNAVDDLRVVDVSVISPQVCWREWGGLPANVICAGGYNTPKGFCQGDSGGPLVCKGMAVGIVSYNRKIGENLGQCNYPDRPNVYTDISKHLDWIRMILQWGKS
ncbi:duodenase-1-like [Pelmatolapia mariae]|uniref:duodenase-1-like n=1 Tax=Pelmatolapia mariae TaxID=158779 RepID=UPI003211CD77